MRKLEDGSETPYELNATYYSALSDPRNEELGELRFLCSQSVAMAMRGIPAVYFHSLYASPNDLKGVEETGRNRTVNRKKWKSEELEKVLGEKSEQPVRVFEWYARTLRRRAACPAFHPDAPQAILDFGSSIFALERTSLDGNQMVLCLFNFQGKETKVPDAEALRELFPQGKARDLITDGEITLEKGKFALRPYQSLWLTSH